MGLRAAREKTYNRTIDRHGLVRFILHCEGVRHPNPGIQEAAIKFDSLLEILASHFKLFAMEVIGSHRKPADWVGRIVFNQVVSTIVELASEA